jgi:hypothetical protein
MKREVLKADLSFLKQYVKEIDAALEYAYSIRDNGSDLSTEEYRNFLIELSKTSGLLIGLAQEASLLVADLEKIARYSIPVLTSQTVSNTEKAQDLLNNIIKSAKGSRGEN